MDQTETAAGMVAKETVINAMNELDRLRSIRQRGEVDPAEADKHREAENAAAAALEAAKSNWFRVDPENAPDPKVSPYIYP